MIRRAWYAAGVGRHVKHRDSLWARVADRAGLLRALDAPPPPQASAPPRRKSRAAEAIEDAIRRLDEQSAHDEALVLSALAASHGHVRRMLAAAVAAGAPRRPARDTRGVEPVVRRRGAS